MEKHTLSVVMPNYNHAHYISEALEAILAQSFRPLEVIVIDDGSSDNSIEVIEAFTRRDPIVCLLRNKRNMGVIFRANQGMELAAGDYVYFAAADDRVLPGLFEKSMSLLAPYPRAGLCCSDPVQFDGRTGIVRENQLHLSDGPCYISPDELVEIQRQRCFSIAGHTTLIKRSAVVEAGKIIPELRWHCDWFFNFVIGFRYGICYIPEPLAALRVLPNSYSAAGTRQWSNQCEVLNHMLRLLRSPAYRDVRPLFQRSAILSCFRSQILRVLLSNPEHWDYLSPLLIRRALWNEALRTAASIVPSPVKRIYRRVRDKHYRDKAIDVIGQTK